MSISFRGFTALQHIRTLQNDNIINKRGDIKWDKSNNFNPWWTVLLKKIVPVWYEGHIFQKCNRNKTSLVWAGATEIFYAFYVPNFLGAFLFKYNNNNNNKNKTKKDSSTVCRCLLYVRNNNNNSSIIIEDLINYAPKADSSSLVPRRLLLRLVCGRLLCDRSS